jgi:hypothetical protein
MTLDETRIPSPGTADRRDHIQRATRRQAIHAEHSGGPERLDKVSSVSSLGRRIGKPTTAGYVVLAVIAILAIGVVVGVIIGGSTGGTIDVVGGFLIVAFILLMVGGPVTRRRGDDPRDHFPPEPPGQTGLH